MTSETCEMLNICRLCAQEPEKSYKLSRTDSNGEELHSLINTYLPIKVYVSDGYPQILCSSCYRKVKRVIRFILEWFKGQKEIGRLVQRRERQRGLEPEVSVVVAPPSEPPVSETSNGQEQTDDARIETASESQEEDTFDCKYCPAELTTSKKIELHNRKEHKDAIKANLECSICEKRFKYRASVTYHTHSEHYVPKKYACRECNMVFKHRLLLRRHQRIHSPQKQFECDKCHKGFRRKDALKSHMAVHGGTTKFSCEICSMEFTFRASYKIHLRTHKTVKSFSCSICDKGFVQKRNLVDHIRTHTGEKPFQCDKCPSQFRTATQLKTHFKTHSEQKKYKCNICGSSFGYLSTLATHRRSHTGETPFNCTICSKSFKDQTNLRKHIRSHSGAKPYECNSCGRKFGDTSNLRKHVKKGNCGPAKDECLPTSGASEEFIYNDPDLAQIICLTYENQDVDVNSFVLNQKASNETIPPLQIPSSQMMDMLEENRSVMFEAEDGSVYQLATFPTGPSLPETPSLPDANGLPSDSSLSEIDCLTRIAEASGVDEIADIDFISDSLLIGSSMG